MRRKKIMRRKKEDIEGSDRLTRALSKYREQCGRLGLPYKKEVYDSAQCLQIEGASWLPVINAVESLVAWQAMNKDWLIKFNQLLAEAKWQDEIDRINAEKANAARKQRR